MMRLIRVDTVLEFEMSVIEGKKVDFTNQIFEEFRGSHHGREEYAILSHCWGAPEQEVSFQDIEQLVTTSDDENRNAIRRRTGYQKIIDTCKRAQQDCLGRVWIDTCCIDKKSSSELLEAINSMYVWYKNAKLCYVHFHDIAADDIDPRYALPKAKWFSRGWTLQELIAPKVVHFFNQKWELIGDKRDLASTLSKVSRIPKRILEVGLDSERPSVAQVLSWAADRKTTREEDRAYSLLGLFGVHMSMLYGEGKHAFLRLQLQIMRKSNDQSIFAWAHSRMTGWSDSFLADDPSCFRDCANVISLTQDELTKALEEDTDISKGELGKIPAKRFRTFAITNDGIRIWLPTTTVGSISIVTLACRDEDEGPALITVGLAHLQSGSLRLFGDFPHPGMVKFEQHFLPYADAKCPNDFTFKLDYRTLSHEGFVQHHIQPTGLVVKDDSVTLSKVNDFAVVTYVRNKDHPCFSVLLSYWRGRHSAFVAFFSQQDLDKEQLAFLRLYALDRLIKEDLKNGYFVQHAHLPRSIQCVRIVHRPFNTSKGYCTVAIDITLCSGCCPPQSQYSNLVEAPQGVMSDYLPKESPFVYHGLLVDSSRVPFLLAQSGIQLGDYGHLSGNGEIFERSGNIFEHAAQLGISIPFDPISNATSHAHRKASNKNPLIAHALFHEANDFHFTSLALYNAIGQSLPDTRELVCLLKALSFHLAGSLLVTTVIQCSECYYDRRESSHSLSLEPPYPKTWKKLHTSTPLHTARVPIYWCPVRSCPKLMQGLRKLRRNFFVLIGWVDKLDKPSNSGQTVAIEDAANFFMDIFGGDGFKDYVGKIAFIRELPSAVVAAIGDKTWSETDKGDSSITQGISKGMEETASTQEQRIEALVGYLTQINSPHPRSGRDVEKKLRERELELRSRPFGVEFLRTIGTVCREWKPGSLGQSDVVASCEILSKTEEIKELQEAFDGTSDEDEQRALTEDIVGKILLLCWCGISLEIKQVLGAVVDRFVNDSAIEQHVQRARANYVYSIGEVFMKMAYRLPDDGLDPFRRMMHDAGAGISKHQLLLAERTKWAAQSIESTREAPKRTSLQCKL